MLQLRTFGGCHVERDGSRLELLSTRRKALALLAVLACAGARGIARDVVAALLWPESDEERARASLKQLVHSLRSGLGTPDVVLTSGDLRLNPERIASDVDAFRDALRRGEDEAAARLCTGPFLDGFYLRGSGEFEHWVTAQRAALTHELANALRHLAERAQRDGDHDTAVGWWRRAVQGDPFSAPATIGLMRALDAASDRPAALRQARVFQRRLYDELESGPDADVAALEEQLRRSPRIATVGARPVVVVLPFANTSGDPNDEPFTDGLTDELIGALAKMRGLAVIGRTSAFAFKGQRVDLAELAQRLHATSVLEGSVRRIGGELHIGVQLLRVPDGVVLWSEHYARDARDLLTVQGEIARAVSLALHTRLDPAAGADRRPGTVEPVAHELYLRGRYFLDRVSAEDLHRAVSCFERAAQHDPTSARAWAALADTHLVLAIMGHEAAATQVGRVHAAVARALALDGELAEAHVSLACVLFAFDWQWSAAEREFDRAIELDPGYALAHHRYGLYLMYRARFPEAQQVLEDARASDPLAASLNMNLGRLHLAAGRAARALPLLQAAVDLSPRLSLAHEQLGHAWLQLQAKAEALAAFQRVAELSGPRGVTRLSYALGATGEHAKAELLANEIAARPDAVTHAFGLAMARTGLGDHDGAFAWLDRAHAARDAFLHTIAATPAFAPLHADPRWGELLRRIGLAHLGSGPVEPATTEPLPA